MKASDPNDLERHILDPNIAKSEAEWWAKGRIEELEQWKFTAEGLLREGRYQELCAELTALQADNVRLWGALNTQLNDCINFNGGQLTLCIMEASTAALAATEPKL